MTRIVNFIEKTISLASGMRNADINFDTMTASAVVMVSDVMRNGRPLVGVAFDSIGRYGHGALLHERFIPRLLNAPPSTYANPHGPGICPHKLWSVVMANEKAGGHGERAGAVGLIDAAAWDLQAKIEDKPLWALLNEKFPGASTPNQTAIYASGGHYRPNEGLDGPKQEISRYCQRGFTRFKIKAGGLPIEQDLVRIEMAIDAAGGAENLSLDFNAGLTEANAHDWLNAVKGRQLAWVEEPVDPLNYQLLAELCHAYPGAISTGENLFSFADTRNLLRYGGMRPNKDLLNMDISLSYGLVEYGRILDLLAACGWSRSACIPHAGHLLSAHAAAGLGLGGHETAPDHPIFGQFPEGSSIVDGQLRLGDIPGTGLEHTAGLKSIFSSILS